MGKLLDTNSDGNDDSMDEEPIKDSNNNKQTTKILKKKIAKRPKGPGAEPGCSMHVEGKNQSEVSKRKIKLNSISLQKKKVNKMDKSCFKEFHLKMKENLLGKTENLKKQNQVLSQGQKKRQKTKDMKLRKKNFLDFQQVRDEKEVAVYNKPNYEKNGTFDQKKMKDSLNTIENDKSLNDTNKNDTKPIVKVIDPANKKNEMSEINRVGNIMKHSQYIKNPLSVLKSHITNTLQAENKL